MDKTIEVVVVATVVLLTAVTVVFIVRGQADSFLGFSDDQQLSSKCQLWQDRGQSTPEECNQFLGGGQDGVDSGPGSPTDGGG